MKEEDGGSGGGGGGVRSTRLVCSGRCSKSLCSKCACLDT